MANPLSGVRSWLYHLGDVSSAKAQRIAASDADLVVIDYATYASGSPRRYTATELDRMRGADDKLIVSYISVGEAEQYRPYWQASWDRTPPNWLSASNPEWPDNFKVKYWEKPWQNIIFNYVDDIVTAGFNGVYLDIIDAFEYWAEVSPRSGINYLQEMAKFVASIHARAEAKLAQLHDTAREFVVIGQNGEELIGNPTYLAAVDGVAKEDLRFFYQNDHESSFRPAPNGWFEGSKPYLEKAEAAEVEVFVVEYMTKARQAQYAELLKAETSYLKAKDIPLYIAEDRDLVDIYDQPGGSRIFGTPRADTLNGTSKDETIIAGDGNDRVAGAGGIDIIGGGAGNDRLSGGSGKDRLWGNDGNDRLSGGSGNDRTWGGEGNDRLSGGSGSDRIWGGDGKDRLWGNDGNDRLWGRGGSDRLKGNAGDDTLAGGGNDDWLDGGAGADRFVFRRGGGTDVIQDFEIGIDQLDVRDPTRHRAVDTPDGIELVYNDGRIIELVGLDIGDAGASLFL